MIRRDLVRIFVFLNVPVTQEKPSSHWPKIVVAIIGLATMALRYYLLKQ